MQKLKWSICKLGSPIFIWTAPQASVHTFLYSPTVPYHNKLTCVRKKIKLHACMLASSQLGFWGPFRSSTIYEAIYNTSMTSWICKFKL